MALPRPLFLHFISIQIRGLGRRHPRSAEAQMTFCSLGVALALPVLLLGVLE